MLSPVGGSQPALPPESTCFAKRDQAESDRFDFALFRVRGRL
jgi:hypothetical protein